MKITAKELKLLISEAIKEMKLVGSERVNFVPGTPEWEDLQKALRAAGVPPVPSKPARPAISPSVSPKVEVDRPVSVSKHPVKMFGPEDKPTAEELDVLKQAAAILAKFRGR